MAAPNYRAIAIQAARRYGIDPALFTRQINQESGFNPNARSGAKPYAAVGIAQIVPHWHPGVDATDPVASLNYAAHLMGTLVKKYGSYAEALSVYNSGKPEAYKDPNFSGGQTYNYVRSIMGGKGLAPTPAPAPFSAPLSMQPLGGLAPSPGGLSGALRASLAAGNKMLGMAPLAIPGLQAPPTMPGFQTLPLRPGMSGGFRTLPATGAPLQVTNLGNWKVGRPVASMTSEGGLHETMGLAGFPAHDYFAPSGSSVVAPITGKVVKVSGHDPSMGPVQGPHGPLGWSVYIKGSDGRTYFLTHMGSRNVHVGQTLRAGQTIGTVANYAKYGTPSHIHMGVT